MPNIKNCPHLPQCPSADAVDRDAAHVVAAHPEQGWSLLCNGVVIFEDLGEILPNGQVLGARNVALVWPPRCVGPAKPVPVARARSAERPTPIAVDRFAVSLGPTSLAIRYSPKLTDVMNTLAGTWP